MISTVYIRLAGPLQSWAGPAITGNIVKTGPLPTLTALRGMVAGAFGYQRDAIPDWVEEISFAVRKDRPGQFTNEFQTISPSTDETGFRRRLLRASNVKERSLADTMKFTPDAQKKTSIVRRTYLADAEFLVAVSHESRLSEIDSVLADPVFSPYLGRKAFPPNFPFYLGAGSKDALNTLPVSPHPSRRRESTEVVVTTCELIDVRSTSPEKRLTVPLSENRDAWLLAISKQLRRRGA